MLSGLRLHLLLDLVLAQLLLHLQNLCLLLYCRSLLRHLRLLQLLQLQRLQLALAADSKPTQRSSCGGCIATTGQALLEGSKLRQADPCCSSTQARNGWWCGGLCTEADRCSRLTLQPSSLHIIHGQRALHVQPVG